MSNTYENDPYAQPVATFMRAAGQDVAVALDRDTPTTLIDLRLRLLNEELDEAFEAINARDADMAAKELADLIYVTVGTAIAFGIPIGEIYAAVAQSNLSKIDPSTNRPYQVDAGGKVLKGPNYQPAEPQVKEIMRTKLVTVE